MWDGPIIDASISSHATRHQPFETIILYTAPSFDRQTGKPVDRSGRFR